jgi:hypothetical protein
MALQSEEVQTQIEHPSVPADTLSHILVMSNIIGHFLKMSESDPAKEDNANYVQASNQPIEYTWCKEDINTGHPVDIDERSESDYSTICVSETADSEIYNQAQQKPLSFNVDQSAKPVEFDPRPSFLPFLEKRLRRQGGVFELPPPEIEKSPRQDGQDIQYKPTATDSPLAVSLSLKFFILSSIADSHSHHHFRAKCAYPFHQKYQ